MLFELTRATFSPYIYGQVNGGGRVELEETHVEKKGIPFLEIPK